MNCPVCGDVLLEEQVAGIELDRCPGCQGYWFDHGEMAHLVPLLAQGANVPNLDLRVIHDKPRKAHPNPQRRCPRCETPMANYNYCYDSNILLDRCPGCRGVWMDGGELVRVAQYVKGHPKLDKLAGAIADRVHSRVSREAAHAELLPAMAGSLLSPGGAGIADLLAAILDVIRRFERD